MPLQNHLICLHNSLLADINFAHKKAREGKCHKRKTNSKKGAKRKVSQGNVKISRQRNVVSNMLSSIPEAKARVYLKAVFWLGIMV